MWPILTDVAWSVSLCVCLLVTTVRPARWRNWSSCCSGYGLGWDQRTVYWMGALICPGEGSIMGDISRPCCKVWEISGMQSIFSTLLVGWQQQCILSLSVLQQLVTNFVWIVQIYHHWWKISHKWLRSSNLPWKNSKMVGLLCWSYPLIKHIGFCMWL